MHSQSARRSASLLAGLVAAGALVLASAPAVVAEPTSSTTSATSTPIESESDTTTPSATSVTTTPKATRTRVPTPDSDEPATSTDEDPTTTVSPTTSATLVESVDKHEDAGGLTVSTGPLVLNAAPKPGSVVSGQMTVQVEDTRPRSTGWNVDVKTTDARGSGGGSFTPGPDSYYRAFDTACSSSNGTMPLTAQTTTVATSQQSCPDARWTSDVGVEIPADVAPDNYSLTITHSVY
ncbi:hypothetical protein [Rhodococcus sp. IEGM 1379]|uniref:hypothetical protein n=1 Tax=Rhodococcus sp. IEGM 1379 TaxID=3047086 RepID=UPI0024B68D20|nr:hypothetical protein [Rhodococcus sp. IEGM 1379]MDI9916886.1 hypothetical protein [Rhodococcus sp. IEGM 1379]